jgi:lysine-N-methylase
VEEGEGDGPDGDAGALFLLLSQWRAACLAAAADDTLGIYQRLGAVLNLGRQTDAALWGEQENSSPTEVLPGHALLWLERLEELEPIDEEWTSALSDAAAAAEYPELMEEFALNAEERQYDRLLYYLLYRYALRSVWDGDPRRWADFAVFGVLTVELLDFGRWLKNGQRFTSQDRQDIARIFSKEIEYDPELMEGLTEIIDQIPPFCAQ